MRENARFPSAELASAQAYFYEGQTGIGQAAGQTRQKENKTAAVLVG